MTAGAGTRFRSAAPHYLRGRPFYAPRLIERVAAACGLGKGHAVLDLGCGPGPLAVAFAPFAGDVLGIDPEAAMIEAAAAHAARAGVTIRLRQARAEELPPDIGRFRIATIGRAFHWMDRARTLALLDTLIEPGGAVVLFRARNPDVPENAWRAPFRALLDRHAVDDGGRAARRAAGPTNEAALLASAFGTLERIGMTERRQTPAADFVARAFSLSSTAPARLGAAAAASLERDVSALMAGHARDGTVTEVVESEAVIARR